MAISSTAEARTRYATTCGRSFRRSRATIFLDILFAHESARLRTAQPLPDVLHLTSMRLDVSRECLIDHMAPVAIESRCDSVQHLARKV